MTAAAIPAASVAAAPAVPVVATPAGAEADLREPEARADDAGAADDPGCPIDTAHLPSSDGVDPDDPRLDAATTLVVFKGARRLGLYAAGTNVACYRVGLGFSPTGHKQVQGDGRTPEGWYRTSDKPWSSFEHAIAIHYPNEADAVAAARDGRIGGATRDRIVADVRAGRVPPQNTKLGGAVLIHGGGSSVDWTLGCVALDDADLLALREALPKRMRTNLLIVR